MKPLQSDPLTDEDREAMLQVWARTRFIWFWSIGADRRDAELMLQLTHYDHWERDYTRDRVRSVATAFRLVWRQI